ncbi:hypothetical protein LCGC14_0265290 [marine sediment metagenome]|uniref:Uncharacterized protein n=1 Tax=marine sediment metagenome TaxID=412755 RepID=A0A0F9U526_9ZZZZ|nr:hypothetical protein [Halomonas sp.]HDZ49484.1 hypothetical protein [Halomonas sp.]HEB03094.1 hypothetical protein [Halomonas sp.]
MHPDEHEQVIQALETLIRETQATIDQVEIYGLNATMPEDYQALLDILDNAIKQQREHTLAMLAH